MSVFPNTQKFKFGYGGTNYIMSSYEMWNFFILKQTFNEKLSALNNKIQIFKDTIENGDNP